MFSTEKAPCGRHDSNEHGNEEKTPNEADEAEITLCVHVSNIRTELEKQNLQQSVAGQVALLGDNGVQRSACICAGALSPRIVKQSINSCFMQTLFA